MRAFPWHDFPPPICGSRNGLLGHLIGKKMRGTSPRNSRAAHTIHPLGARGREERFINPPPEVARILSVLQVERQRCNSSNDVTRPLHSKPSMSVIAIFQQLQSSASFLST